MTDKTFEEQFPRLKGKLLVIPEQMINDYGNQKIIGLFQEDIQQCCLDKQKVRDVIINKDTVIHKHDAPISEIIKSFKKELLEELGL